MILGAVMFLGATKTGEGYRVRRRGNNLTNELYTGELERAMAIRYAWNSTLSPAA